MHIAIALIHNGDTERLSHIRPAARALADRWRADLFEVFEQPAIAPVSRAFALWRKFCHRRAEHIWRRHRGVAAVAWRDRIKISANRLWRFFFSSTPAEPSRRSVAIEMIVAAKHIEAWRRFDGDLLLVLEDDAVFLPQSAEDLDRLRRRIESRNLTRDFYMNIAGGLALENLELSAVRQERSGGFIAFAKPVTNTACGYMLDGKTAAAFCKLLDRPPWFGVLGIDWVINMLMVERTKAGVEFTCLHAAPPLLQHGSMTGAYVGWRRRQPD